MEKNKTVDFSKDALLPLIIKFSVPAAISLLVTAIYNIVDKIFVGNFNGTTALAALSICFPLSFMMVAFGLNCSAGGSSLFSLFNGKNDIEKMNLSFGNAVTLTVISEVALMIVLLLFPDFFLKIFGVTDTTYEMAYQYYRICAFGCLFQGLTLVFCDFVRVSGKPVLGMCVTGIGAVTNVILDAVFVGAMGWGVQGAAFATVIGQILSAVFGGYLVLSGKTLVQLDRKIFQLHKDVWKRIVSCGFAFWIAQMAMGFISLVYNGQLGKYGGDGAISVYAVISSIMTFVIMPASGISQGIQPILGNNYGNNNGKRVMQTMYRASIFSIMITTVIWLIVLICPKQIIVLFGGDAGMLEIGIHALRMNFCIAPVLGFVMLATTFFQSIGKPVPSIVISLLRQIVFLVPLIYVLPTILDLNGIFIAQPISDALALIISLILVIREGRKMITSEKRLVEQ